jgi:hypothetical protein
MVQTSVQFTPVQVLQAARRAEAEGKMDYALQFYRHLVEQHGGSPEAQEAREGLFRIAEWRWGEARVARAREGANPAEQGQAAGPSAQPAVQQTPPQQSGQRVYNVGGGQQPQAAYPADQQASSGPSGLPQIISRHHAREDQSPSFQARFRLSKFVAHTLSGVGWLTLLLGISAGAAGLAGLVAELSSIAMLGAPFGVMLAVPAVLFGLILVVAGQLAAALFDSANATLEMAAIERGRTSA